MRQQGEFHESVLALKQS